MHPVVDVKHDWRGWSLLLSLSLFFFFPPPLLLPHSPHISIDAAGVGLECINCRRKSRALAQARIQKGDLHSGSKIWIWCNAHKMHSLGVLKDQSPPGIRFLSKQRQPFFLSPLWWVLSRQLEHKKRRYPLILALSDSSSLTWCQQMSRRNEILRCENPWWSHGEPCIHSKVLKRAM